MGGGEWERTEDQRKVCQALEKVASEVGAKSIGAGMLPFQLCSPIIELNYPSAVAIAYVLQKTPYVFPIIGGRKVEHLHANIEALNVALSPEQISYLEGILPFDIGFPYNTFVSSFLGIYSTCFSFSSMFLR